MTWLANVGFFALLFFVLVFVHELGHYLMAKWVGIRVERFAIGMGPTLFKFQKGDTEYKLGLFPIGGYVKMSGDDPSKVYSEEEKKVGFLTQKPPQKLLVVFGGPVFNLILPIFLFGLLLASGIPTLEPVIGTISKDSSASEAGLASGDRVKSIEGKPIAKWGQLETAIEKAAGQKLDFEIERINLKSGQAEVIHKAVTPKLTPSKSRFGEDIQVGRVGVSPEYIVPLVYFEKADSPLAVAGVKPFDRMTEVNGVKIVSLEQQDEVFKNLPASTKSLQLKLDRNEEVIEATVNVPASGKGTIQDRIGLISTILLLGHVEPDSPAAKSGLKENDLLVSIGGKVLTGWEDVSKFVRESDGKPLEVVWHRNGEKMTATIVAEKIAMKDPMMGKDNPTASEPIFRIGIAPASKGETTISIERSLNPLNWAKRGFVETWNMTSITFQGLVKLFTGQVPLKNLGGPVMIYKVASGSYRMAGGGYFGWYSFLNTLAMLSITLGLFNLFPIPILDGGHATFFILEWIRGKPVSLKAMEVAMQVGLVIVVCLIGLVLFNDFDRYELFDPVLKIFR